MNIELPDVGATVGIIVGKNVGVNVGIVGTMQIWQ